MAILFANPWYQPLSGSVATYPGAKLYFYQTGTTTLQTVYTDSALSVAHANPVVADADGYFAPIYLDPAASTKYKAVLKDASDVTLQTVDPIASALTDLSSTATVSDGTALVGYKHGGSTGTFTTGAASTTVQRKLDGWWDAVADGGITQAEITNGTDVSAKIQAGLDASKYVWIPEGTFIIGTALTTTQANIIAGPGTLKLQADCSADHVLKINADYSTVTGITIDGNKSAHTTYVARGEGLRVDSDYNLIHGVFVNNTPDTASGDAISVLGDHNTVSDCHSENAGFGSFRCRGDFNKYYNITGINFRSRGFYCDINCTRFDLIGAYFTSNTTLATAGCIVVDPSLNGLMGTGYFKNVYCSGPDSIPSSNNVAKFVLMDECILEDCEFIHTSSNLTSVRIQWDVDEGLDRRAVNRLFMKRCRLSRDLNIDGSCEYISIEDCVIGTGDAASISRCINELASANAVIRGTRFYNYTGGAINVEVTSDTFVDADVNTGTDRITFSKHGFVTGQVCLLTTTGALPTGLAASTYYYIKKIDANTIELYSDEALSSIINITAAAGGGTHTLSAQTRLSVYDCEFEAESSSSTAPIFILNAGTNTLPGTIRIERYHVRFGNKAEASSLTNNSTTNRMIQVGGSEYGREFISTAIPAAGTWKKGDFVRNTSPSLDGNNMSLQGWLRLTNGANHSSGTDWALSYVSHVSPAT